jgi:hypothetical protein
LGRRAEGGMRPPLSAELAAARMPSGFPLPRSWLGHPHLLSHPGGLRRRTILAGLLVAEVAQLAANGHRRPVTSSHIKPRNTWSDAALSLIYHRLATLRNRLILKQVRERPAYCRARDHCPLAKILFIASAPTVMTGRIWWR